MRQAEKSQGQEGDLPPLPNLQLIHLQWLISDQVPSITKCKTSNQ